MICPVSRMVIFEQLWFIQRADVVITAANFPFLDHQAPSFDTLVDFCIDASAWLDKDKENVVVIHCKAGKGRTGTVIAALLLDMGQAKNAQEAIDLYGKYRTKNQRVVSTLHIAIDSE